MGLWLVVPEHLQLGTWDLIKGFTGNEDRDIDSRLAMQLVNEATLCKNRVRKENYITHQGFEISSGFSFLPSDAEIRKFLARYSIS